MLAASGRDFVLRSCPIARVRDIVHDPAGFDRDLWDEMRALGLARARRARGARRVGRGHPRARGAVRGARARSGAVAARRVDDAGGAADRGGSAPTPNGRAGFPRSPPVTRSARWRSSNRATATSGVRPRLAGGAITRAGRRSWCRGPASRPSSSCAPPTVCYLVEPDPATVAIERHRDLGSEPLFAVELRDAAAEPLGGERDEHDDDAFRRSLDCCRSGAARVRGGRRGADVGDDGAPTRATGCSSDGRSGRSRPSPTAASTCGPISMPAGT